MLSLQSSFFPVHKDCSKIFPSFDKPKIIGYWSLDRDRKLHWDSSQLRYYTPFKRANVEYDLKKGWAEVERKPECLDDEKSEHILRWIGKNYEKILDDSDDKKWLQPDFILYRGMLAKIIKSPFIPGEGWIICAAKFNGTIYLCQFDNEAKKLEKAHELEEIKKKISWGHKFEQYMLSKAPGEPPDTSKAINESEEFCCVYKTRLNKHNLLYAAEVDGVYSNKKFEDPLPVEELKFIELKTHSPIRKWEQELKWKRLKTLEWWAQNYLIGIEDIVCGERDYEEGIVRYLQNRRVCDLERFSEGAWNAAICMNYGDEFLKFIKRTVTNDYDETIYKFERKPFDQIIVTTEKQTSEYAFLPEWYIKLSKK